MELTKENAKLKLEMRNLKTKFGMSEGEILLSQEELAAVEKLSQVSETTSHRITGLVSSDDHVLCGDENGDLVLRDLYSLAVLTTLPLQLPIQTLALTDNKSHILAPLR